MKEPLLWHFRTSFSLASCPICAWVWVAIWLLGILRIAHKPLTGWRAVIIGVAFFAGMQMSNLSEDQSVAAVADGH